MNEKTEEWIYFGDVFKCTQCKRDRGIPQYDNVERSQKDYIELTDRYDDLNVNNVKAMHFCRDGWICRECNSKNKK